MPALWPELSPILLAYHRLGKDANGGLLYSERAAYLAERVEDPGEREAWHFFLDVADRKLAEVRRQEFEEARKERG